MGIVLLYNLTPLLRDYRFFGFSPICSAYRRSCNFVLTSSHFGHSPYVTQGERLRSISLLPCFDFKLRYPVMLRDMAGERCTKPFLFWNKKCRSSSSTVFLQRKNIGEVSRSDGGVNSYSQKVYEIFSTPLLRDYCIFGLSPICSAYLRLFNFVLTPSPFGHSPSIAMRHRGRGWGVFLFCPVSILSCDTP